jgi:hypothetical protein
MSTLTADPQFARGTTLGGGAAVTFATYPFKNVAGVEKVFTDVSPRLGLNLSNRTVRCIALRNRSGATLTAGQLVAFSVDEVIGLASAADVQVGVVDEYLSASGCKVDDVCWVVTNGPTAINTAASLTVGATIGVGTLGAAIAGTGLGLAISPPVAGKVRALVGTSHFSAVAVPAAGTATVWPAPRTLPGEAEVEVAPEPKEGAEVTDAPSVAPTETTVTPEAPVVAPADVPVEPPAPDTSEPTA